jgi:hypothetical protein
MIAKNRGQPIFNPTSVSFMPPGRSGESQQNNSNIKHTQKEYDFGMTAYRQGRIKAQLGETEEALHYFRIALDEGITFTTAYTFKQDPYLNVLLPIKITSPSSKGIVILKLNSFRF